MRIETKMQVVIDAPASKVWDVIAHEFEYIDRWSSGIKISKAMAGGHAPKGAGVCGRLCDKI